MITDTVHEESAYKLVDKTNTGEDGDVMAEPIVTGCMLVIGNDILSGRTQDTNLAHLAKVLNELRVRLVAARVIPDIEDVIVNTVNECRAKFDYIFTTGGIGPTHDDITAVCMAKAFGVEVIRHPEIEAVIRRREASAEVMESRFLMARVPEGSKLIDNPTGGPQGFQIDNVFVMAGVPSVMQAMASTFSDKQIKGAKPVRSRSVGAYLGESAVAGALEDIQNQHPEVDLGSYPFYREKGYGTNLVMRGTDEAELEVVKSKVGEMIKSFGAEPFDP